MLFGHLVHSGHLVVFCQAVCRGPQAGRVSSHSSRLPALCSQGRSGVELDTLGKGGLATGTVGIARDVP